MATLGLSYTDEPSLSLSVAALYGPHKRQNGEERERAPHARNITTIAYLHSARIGAAWGGGAVTDRYFGHRMNNGTNSLQLFVVHVGLVQRKREK